MGRGIRFTTEFKREAVRLEHFPIILGHILS